VAGLVTGSTTVGGTPGLETSYQLNSAGGQLAAGQLAVAPKPGEFCFVTLTASAGTFSNDALATVAQTAQFT
jgi:hypothetical protein